ncbi:MAG: VCBS repeat-containing protein [Desulfobulbaceae bacterium]|nr:VCBS repeat-containing protein [Desulfobulbaceae bacterium]
MITAILVFPVTHVFLSIPDVIAQEVDPGATDPIVPAARRFLFPDQHALLAMPQDPTNPAPSVTYTDWARNANLTRLQFQDAFVPALQGIEEARSAAGHILSQQTEQVAVGRYTGSGTENSIQVDILRPTGELAPGTTTVAAFSTSALFEWPVPNSFDVAVGGLNNLIDEDGIGHDEVAVCYFEEQQLGQIGTFLVPKVTVLDYTDLADSGVIQTTADEPAFISLEVFESTLFDFGSDSLISCATGDLNGDGLEEIILAYVANNGRARVGLFRYLNDGENPPSLERIGSSDILTPIRNQLISGSNPLFWGGIDVATGDFNGNGQADIALSVVNRQERYDGSTLNNYSYPGIYFLSSDSNFNLTSEQRFAEFEPAITRKDDFKNNTGSYACRPTPTKQACETTRASVVTGLFKFHPPTGFDFDRRQPAVVYNVPFAQGGGLRALALEVSEDMKTIDPLGETITLPQQSCNTNLCPSSQRFSVNAGGFIGAGDFDRPQWSLAVSNWEATQDGNGNNMSAGQFHGFWLQSLPVDVNGNGGGLDLLWDEVLLNGEVVSGATTARLPAIAWDREGASLYLGSPVNIVVHDLVRTEYIIAEPPKHTYWWPPEAINPADGEVLNVSRDDDFFIELSDETNLDYSETSRNITDWSIGGSVTLSAKASVTSGADLGIVKTSATVSTEVVGKVSYDYNENKDEYEKDYRSQTTTFTGSTDRDDLLIGKLQTYDIWRYPISGISLEDDLNPFWEISFPGKEVTVQGGGLSFDWYIPTYENGNILSYPALAGVTFTPPDCCAEFTFLEGGQEVTTAIPFLDDRLLALDGTGATINLQFSESSGEGQTKTYNKTLSESLDVKVGFKASSKVPGQKVKVEGSAAVNINNSNSWSGIGTTDSNTNTSTGFKLTKPARNPNQAYLFLPTFYLAKDGTTKVTHAVDILGASTTFWNETYGSLPDPAFKLPNRFSPIAIFMGRTIWEPNESDNAKKIRGFFTRFAEPDEAGIFPLVDGAVTEGELLRLEVEVHNYSVGQGISGLKVQFEAARLNDAMNMEVSRLPINCQAGSSLFLALNPLEQRTAVCVWNTSGFGPGIPGGDLYYRIYAVLDPDDEIEEIYEGTVGPGQNNEGWGLLGVADPELTFGVPTPTEEHPLGADVQMSDASLAIEVDGNLETTFARVTASQLTPLRVCVNSDQAQTGYHHILVYDGDPSAGGVLLADELIPGIDQGGACDWIPDFRFDEPGEHLLFAQVLESRDDGLLGNATDTLQVLVDPIPVVNPDSGQGRVEGIGSKRSRGQLEMSATFPYDGDLDLSGASLVIANVLDETGGAGELLPGIRELTGQDLTLFSRSKGRNSARFETPGGQRPKVRLDLRHREGMLKLKLHIKGAEIIEPIQCKRDFYYGQANNEQEHAEKRSKKGKFSKRDDSRRGRDAVTELTTRFFLFDDQHGPVDLTLENERWTCRENGRGEVKSLRLALERDHDDYSDHRTALVGSR